MKTEICRHCGDNHVCIPTTPKPVRTPRIVASIVDFVQHGCHLGDEYRCSGSELYAAYVAWSGRYGMTPVWNNGFSQALRSYGFARRLSGTVTYYGLRPKEDADWPKKPGEVGYLLPPVEDLSRSEDRQVNEGVR